MAAQSKWYWARIIAQSEQLPPVCEPGATVALSLAPCGVRVMGDTLSPQVLSVEEAKRILQTVRDDSGNPVVANSGRLEAEWSRWFSGSK